MTIKNAFHHLFMRLTMHFHITTIIVRQSVVLITCLSTEICRQQIQYYDYATPVYDKILTQNLKISTYSAYTRENA